MHWPQYDPEDHEVLMQIVGLNGGAMYDHLTPMEKEWSEYLNGPSRRTTTNGTAALTSMYFATGFPPGTEFLVPSYTFYAPWWP